MEVSNPQILSPQKSVKLDINQVRGQFPILQQLVHGNPLIYFDNAATNQKPKVVIDALLKYYTQFNANIHRGIHTLAEKATASFENTRKTVQAFINAREVEEVIFTKSTTEGLNLVASTYGRSEVKEGDEVIISTMEHHSNIVPWQILCEEKNANLKIIPITDQGELILEEFEKLLTERTGIVAIAHVSNSLGIINPLKKIVQMAHQKGAIVVVDGAQASSHLILDMQQLDCDFYTFSGHKCYGPTGVGVLYGKRKLLEKMPPYQGGGEMIKEVAFEKTTYNEIPFKFEAGTPNIADVVAFKKAIEFVNGLGKEPIAAHEDALLAHAQEQLSEVQGLRIIGQGPNKVSVVSFLLDKVHPFDLGLMLDAKGIAVRTGHHCTQPLMARFGIEGTTRASFSVYNTIDEIDQMVEALNKISKMKN